MGFVHVLYLQARHLLSTEGAKGLVRKMIRFIVERYLFQNETSYLYEISTQPRDAARFVPNVEDYTVHVVSSSGQLAGLARNGYGNIRELMTYAKQGLDNHGVAFLIFVGSELAHMAWVMTTDKGKNVFDNVPYRVHFTGGEACLGGVFTAPQYRNRGLFEYSTYLRLEYLRERGVRSIRGAVGVHNYASQAACARFAPRVYAKVHYLRILWLKHYKETSLP